MVEIDQTAGLGTGGDTPFLSGRFELDRTSNRVPRGFCVILGALFCLAFAPAAFGASGRITVQSGGVTRSAIFVEHARLKKTRRPVVIILHSGGFNARYIRHALGLEEKPRSASPVMIYPDAISKSWSDISQPGETKDAVFIHDLVNQLVNEGIADRRRIFLVGGSSGGMTALKIVCSGSTDFAGVVAILATLPADLAGSCKPARPIPLLFVLGTSDPHVPYNGGPANLVDTTAELLSGPDTLNLFAKASGCGDAHTTTVFADHDPRDNSRLYLDKWTGCKVPVELLRVEGGGHFLPRLGSVGPNARASDSERGAGAGQRNRDADGPGFIWEFLRRLGA